MDFVVVSGEAAGMNPAGWAKQNRPHMNVTVLEKNECVSFSAYGLPYSVADPNRPINDLVVGQTDVFREKQGINLLTGYRVDTIDRDPRLLMASDRWGKPSACRTIHF